MAKFYITTTLPYVNADPHVGFAMEIVRADVLARLHRVLGDEVFFNTGTDEHGQKIYQKAIENNQTPQEYCDEYAARFGALKEKLNLSYDNFIRTTDQHHILAAQEFWRRCDKNGDIYKKEYSVKYCVGCELEKTDSELENGRCPLHPSKELELRSEENYFFRFSKYQQKLLDFYNSHPDFVYPRFRGEEIAKFVSGGLQDFSISRLKEKMPWGVEVPNDSTQVMYVWFDALVNYISALGWPGDEKKFNDFWPGIQLCGKDNLRQQTAMWQAMLMSAGLPNTKQVMVGGFIMSNGQKMSKSLGNVIDPIGYANKYGVDSLRYYLLAKMSVIEDSDMTKENFEEVFQADLANGLSNLCARVATMAEKIGLEVTKAELKIRKEVVERLDNFDFPGALALIWELVQACDKEINEKEVWKLSEEEKREELSELVRKIRQIGIDLSPILPQTAKTIIGVFGVEKIVRGDNLFQRLPKASN